MKRPIIALMGNPNSGKSSLFNYLTGMRQEVSNFPGVTVDKKTGIFILSDGSESMIIDFPGTYSIYPNSTEEKIVVNAITNTSDPNYPDMVVYVVDVTQLERHLLFATQICDLGFPMVVILNMADLAFDDGLKIDKQYLEAYLGVSVICTSVRNHYQLDKLNAVIEDCLTSEVVNPRLPLYKLTDTETFVASRIKKNAGIENTYLAKIIAHHATWLDHIPESTRTFITELIVRSGFNNIRSQVQETMARYEGYGEIVKITVTSASEKTGNITDRIDRLVTHRVLGPVIFFVIMTFVFQSIYSWSTYPMDWIEQGFLVAGDYINSQLSEGWFTDLLVNGVLAGLGGVLVFVPQIAVLFFLIALLEESGYMSRVVFMFDSIMQRFGMNGRSMVSLISSGACAIPAIMATRTISNPKERLITILVSPLISCSARLPVYAVLVGFVVPSGSLFGVLNYKGLVFMGLYLLGIAAALLSALFFKYWLKTDSGSFLMIELPNYKPPMWKNVIITVKEKVSAFIIGAGKIIVVISIGLWFLASYGPPEAMQKAEQSAAATSMSQHLDPQASDNLTAALKIEASFIGHLGKWIEPAIKPLGFDWKIGIALLTSFAAREVFVGTMATIYSIGTDSDEKTIREKMAGEIRPGTQLKLYTPATALSLLVFYVFAMQCMSTLAIVRRETNSWKWPLIQFLYMSVLAYLGGLTVYQILG